MRCPVCAANGPLSAERCVECGADLFAVAPKKLADHAVMFIVLGTCVVILVAVAAATHDSGSHHRNDKLETLAAIVTIAAAGYFLSGHPLPALMTVLAIMTLWLYGPGRFGKRDGRASQRN